MATYMRVFEHTAENFIGDVAYFTIALYIAENTGFSEIFIPYSARVTDGTLMVALRQAAYLGVLVEIRKWLQDLGVDTNIVHMLRAYL